MGCNPNWIPADADTNQTLLLPSCRYYINFLLILFAISLSAMCTETQQCYVYDLGSNCTQMRGSHRSHQQAKARAPGGSEGRGGFGGAAVEPPDEAFCCRLSHMGFTWIYDNWGQYALSGYAMVLTIAFAQMCFQSAACGCAQRWSDLNKNRCERLGHLFLACLLVPSLLPIPYMWRYIMSNGLLSTVAINFVLAKGGSMVGALFLMSCLWWILWEWQSDPVKEGRMGATTFYIQWVSKTLERICYLSHTTTRASAGTMNGSFSSHLDTDSDSFLSSHTFQP